MKNKVRSRLYLIFRLKDILENPYLAFGKQTLQILYVWSLSVNNEGHLT